MKTLFGISLMGVVVLFACQTFGQGHFRITYTPRPREAAGVTLDGRVFNDADIDVLDVWVTAEGLDTSGKVLATGITFVSFVIPRHGSATFLAKLPVAQGKDIRSFHLTVTSYRDAAAAQSP
jgi:hypothetical protein